MITSILISFLAAVNPVYQAAQSDTLTLEHAYQLAYEYYPTAKNIALQKKITVLNVHIANTGYYPQIKVKGRATYQSEVPEFSMPGGAGPDPLSKDQYRASLSVVQTIFNGGAVGIRKELQQAIGRQKVNATKVSLYQIRRQVNQVYYGILLSQEHLKVTQLLIDNLKSRLKTIRSRVEHGVLLASQQYILEAELLKAKQNRADIKANIKAGYLVLSELTGPKITFATELTLPQAAVNMQFKTLPALRPRYGLFESRLNTLQTKKKLTGNHVLPRVSAFGTASYGRPGLNILNNDFHGFYIVGVQLQWDFWDVFNSNREQQILEIKQNQVRQERLAFDLQIRTSLDRISQQIKALHENIERAEQIVALREKIVHQSAQQLKHGVITSTEYVTELTKANKARLSLFISRVKLAQARTEYATVLGLPIEKL